MKEFLNPKIRSQEKRLHDLRMNQTVTDDYYWEANLNRARVTLTDEQVEQMQARDEENRRRNHNEFGDPKYWTPEYLERKYADKQLREFNL